MKLHGLPQPKAWLDNVPVYTPGRSDVDGGAALAKLSSNENALGPSVAAKAAYAQAISELHRYPDGSALALRTKLAALHGLSADNIICGNGSEELIGLAIQAFVGSGDELIYCAKGFIGYPIGALRNGARPVAAPPADVHPAESESFCTGPGKDGPRRRSCGAAATAARGWC